MHWWEDHQNTPLGIKPRYRTEYIVAITVEENINIPEIYILSLEELLESGNSSYSNKGK